MTDHARCEERIRDLETQVTASAARAIAREQEHAADLRAARGALTRLREAIVAGAADEAQERSLLYAAWLATTAPTANRPTEATTLGAAFLALHEEHRSLRAHYLATLDGVQGVIERARSAK